MDTRTAIIYHELMFKHRMLLAAALSFAFVPASLSACDLDGLPGFHRANPFGPSTPLFRSAPLPRPAQEPEAAADKTVSAKRSNQPTVSAPEPRRARVWDDQENPGPISAEDKATFF